MPGDIVRREDIEQLGAAFSIGTKHTDHQEHHEFTPEEIARLQSAGADAYFASQANVPLQEALSAGTFRDFKELAEKAYLTEKLREHNWNVSRTAKALDIQRSHLYTKIRAYGLMKEGGEHIIEEEEET